MKRRPWLRPILTVLLVLAICLILAGAASACPMCKDSTGQVTATGFSNDASGSGVTRGFGYSVYTMLLGFFGAVGLISYNLFRGIRGR
jgi:hypothetical protein